ncbi:MAG: hypothetical protein M3P46_03065, partial [Actinomycetota bacterium]|nr:hypothetical protein [Actinomycetota bacterium]
HRAGAVAAGGPGAALAERPLQHPLEDVVRRTSVVAACLALVGLPVPAASAPAAAAAVDAPHPVLTTACAPVHADVSRSSDGLLRRFASAPGDGCSSRITYLRGLGDSWTRIATPYAGTVLASARDDTGTYVLYRTSYTLRLGKYTAAGEFLPSRRLSYASGDAVAGDLVARGGEWWAVWTEPVGSFETGELFQAKTVGADVSRQRLTTNALPDLWPRITLQPSGRATMVWQRNDAPAEPDSSDVHRGTSTGGAWTFTRLLYGGYHNTQPSIASSSSSVLIGWIRDGLPYTAESTGGAYALRAHPRPDQQTPLRPEVAVAGSSLHLAYLVVGEEAPDEQVLVRSRVEGVWRTRTAATVGPAGAGQLLLHAVTGTATRARVLYSTGPRLWQSTVS